MKPATIPGGRALTATHWGDYANMRSTYDVLHAEVKAKDLKRIWMSLEIYGDMYDARLTSLGQAGGCLAYGADT